MFKNSILKALPRRPDGTYRMSPYGWGRIYILSAQDAERYATWEARALAVTTAIVLPLLVAGRLFTEAYATDLGSLAMLVLVTYAVLRHLWIARTFERNPTLSPHNTAADALAREGYRGSFIEAMSHGSIARMVILAVIAVVFSAGGWFAVVVELGRGQAPNTGTLVVTFFFTAAAYVTLRALILRWRRRRTSSREPLP